MPSLKPVVVVFFAFLTTTVYLLVLSVGYEPVAEHILNNFGNTIDTVGGSATIRGLWDTLFIYIPLIWNAGAIAFAALFYMREERYVGGGVR